MKEEGTKRKRRAANDVKRAMQTNGRKQSRFPFRLRICAAGQEQKLPQKRDRRGKQRGCIPMEPRNDWISPAAAIAAAVHGS